MLEKEISGLLMDLNGLLMDLRMVRNGLFIGEEIRVIVMTDMTDMPISKRFCNN